VERPPVGVRGGCVSWENLRNLLKRNGPIWHQLGQVEADRVGLQAVEADGKNLDCDDEGLHQRALALFRQPAQLAPYDHERARHGREASKRARREPDDGKGRDGSSAGCKGQRPPYQQMSHQQCVLSHIAREPQRIYMRCHLCVRAGRRPRVFAPAREGAG